MNYLMGGTSSSLAPGRIPERVYLFCYGSAVHFFMIRLFASGAIEADRSFVDHPATNIGLALLGGFCVQLFFVRLLGKIRAGITRDKALSLGIRYAILSTALAVQLFAVLASLVLTFTDSTSAHIGFAKSLWWQWLALELVGIIFTFVSIPLDALYGCLASEFMIARERPMY